MTRWLMTAAAIVLSAAGAWAAPVAQVLEDFEGDVPALPGASVVEIDGNHVLRWEPQMAEPFFLNFEYRGRGIEMTEWDRLVFRYRIEAERVDWWGVKIIDHPLADGLQATYRLPRDEVVPGEWAEADIALHPPMWRWGDTPNESAQTLIFRASGVRGDAPVFLIDDVRVERDVLHASVEPAGETTRVGDELTRSFRIALSNRGDEDLTVSFETAEVTDGARVALPEPVEVAGGAEGSATVTLAIPADGEPLSLWRAGVAAVTDDDDRAEVEPTMSIPLGEVEHPCLLVAKADIPRILERIERHEWAAAAWERIKSAADAALAREVVLPDRGGQWYHWYTCEKCGSRLRTVSPTEHECPSCGATYTGWPYDDVPIMSQHSAWARAIRDLGLAYALTGEAAYADKAREILLAYADVYLNYPLHNIRGEEGSGAMHVAAQPLSEAVWLIPVVQGFDCIHDALSDADRQTIAEQLLLPAAEIIRPHARSIHNIPCWENSSFGLVGITLGVEELAAQAINGQFGFRNQIAHGVNDDGQWYEGAWGYHYYTMSALEPLAVAAEHVGIDLYTERYLSMFLAPVQMMGPTGALPAFNDSGRTSALGRATVYENGYAHRPRPELALVAGRGNRQSMEALLFGAEEIAPAGSELASAIFPAAGVAVLRTDGEGQPTNVVAGVPANYVALDYGPHGGGHGHPDKLGFEMYALGRLVATDPGSIAYGNPAHGGWYKQTLSHNTVTVDGVSQAATEGTLLFSAFGRDMAMAAAETDGAYAGVVLRRVMALLPDMLLDITLALSDEAHQYDWAYHSRGEFAMPLALTEPAQPPGEGPWQWAEQVRTAGSVDGWQASWAIDDAMTVRAAQAASAPVELLTGVGRSNPPTARDPFVVARADGTQVAWGTVLSWAGDAPTAALLTGSRGGEELPIAEACGVEATVGDRRIALLSAHGDAELGEITLEGAGALVILEGDGPVAWLVADGTTLSVGGETLGAQ